MADRMTGDEASALIEGFDRERWYAEGTRVMRKDEDYAGGEEIADIDGFRDEECDVGVANIIAAAPRALLAVVELTRERDEARARIARYVRALDDCNEANRTYVAGNGALADAAGARIAATLNTYTLALAALRETPAGEGER